MTGQQVVDTAANVVDRFAVDKPGRKRKKHGDESLLYYHIGGDGRFTLHHAHNDTSQVRRCGTRRQLHQIAVEIFFLTYITLIPQHYNLTLFISS